MKTYYYKKAGITFQVLILLLFDIIFAFVTYQIFHNMKLAVLCGFGMVAVSIFSLYIGKDKLLKKAVIIQNDTIEFVGFDVSIDKENSYKFLFSDIIRVSCSHLPIVGLYVFRVKVKEYQACFKISLFFENHKELYYEIYDCVKKYNKEAFIDPKIVSMMGDYINEKQE